MIETSWTKEQVEDLLKREKLAYQKIELPYCLSTGGKDRSETSAKIFADGVKGKSTFIGRLRQEEVPEVAEAIGMDNNDNWIYADAARIRDIKTENIRKAVYHYDILRTYKSDTYTYSREQGIDVLDCADKRTAVTVWCDPDVLCQRQQIKLRKGMRHWRERRVKDVLALYKNGSQLAEQYRKWVMYCRQKQAQLFFVNCTGEPRLLTHSEWDRRVKSLE
jgi:hypothetical protein